MGRGACWEQSARRPKTRQTLLAVKDVGKLLILSCSCGRWPGDHRALTGRGHWLSPQVTPHPAPYHPSPLTACGPGFPWGTCVVRVQAHCVQTPQAQSESSKRPTIPRRARRLQEPREFRQLVRGSVPRAERAPSWVSGCKANLTWCSESARRRDPDRGEHRSLPAGQPPSCGERVARR